MVERMNRMGLPVPNRLAATRFASHIRPMLYGPGRVTGHAIDTRGFAAVRAILLISEAPPGAMCTVDWSVQVAVGPHGPFQLACPSALLDVGSHPEQGLSWVVVRMDGSARSRYLRACLDVAPGSFAFAAVTVELYRDVPAEWLAGRPECTRGPRGSSSGVPPGT